MANCPNAPAGVWKEAEPLIMQKQWISLVDDISELDNIRAGAIPMTVDEELDKYRIGKGYRERGMGQSSLLRVQNYRLQ